jgi:hypothetical protein
LGKLYQKVANFRVSTTEGFDSEWEELSARGLKLETVLVFVDFAVEGVGGCLKGFAVA